MTQNTFYITTPIYYVNGEPHLGHIYTLTACDVIARFKRLDGYAVKYLTGTDEHGLKVWQAARDQGKDPQAFCDEIAEIFKSVLPEMNISNDDFIRTTEARHKEGAQAFWRRLEDNGDIYLDTYAGWYAVRDEAYYSADELTTGEDGRKYAPSGAPVEWMEEESYFFRLSKYQDRLLQLYEANPGFVRPETRLNEVRSFVQSGLRDVSISRTTFSWGIPVPGNEKHVMYVWIDALTNYITALGYPDTGENSDYTRFWPANVHMMAKEIIRFHAVYWPAFLMSAGLEVPERIFAHGWLTVEGEKMSKSVGNVIKGQDLLNRYGRDPSRYTLMKMVPFGNDGDFNHDHAVHMVNADLANGLGNLAQRTLSMIAKNCHAQIPEHQDFTADDRALSDLLYDRLIEKMRTAIDAQKPHEYLQAVWEVVHAANAYVDHQAPWVLKKEDPGKMSHVLYVLAETLRVLGLAIQPIMPDKAAALLDLLAVPEDRRNFSFLSAEHALTPGTPLPAPQALFPRIET